MKILFAATEIGSFNSVFPCYLEYKSEFECLFYSSSLAKENVSIDKIFEPKDAGLKQLLIENRVKILVYSVNIHSEKVLKLAKRCKELNIKLIHILDYWNGYIERMTLNSEIVLPDIYVVPDQKAYHEAVKFGVPAKIISVGGNPAFSNYLKKFIAIKSEFANQELKDEYESNLAFISEPVHKDQGDIGSIRSRGYTEYSVLNNLYDAINHRVDIKIDIFPHPRQDIQQLKEFLERFDKNIFLFREKNHKLISSNINRYKGIIGMSSTVLYEAWLIGFPVLSLQPNLKIKSLNEAMNRDGIKIITNQTAMKESIRKWINSVYNNTQSSELRIKELQIHADSIARIRNLILSYI